MKLIVASDLHIPLHDNDAVNDLIKRVSKVHPDVLCLNGDILDCDSLSGFLSDPTGIKLQGEIDQAREIIYRLRKALGRGKFDLCLGNHEDRLRQYLWKNPAFVGLTALTFPSLLGITPEKIHAYGEPVFYDRIAVYHTETMGRANKNNEKRALDRVTRTGAQVVVTGHMHSASIIWTHDREGLGCSVATPCLQGKQEWSKPYPSWDLGYLEITVDTGRFPRIVQVIL